MRGGGRKPSSACTMVDYRLLFCLPLSPSGHYRDGVHMVGVFLTSWDGLFETEQVCGFTLRKLIFTF